MAFDIELSNVILNDQHVKYWKFLFCLSWLEGNIEPNPLGTERVKNYAPRIGYKLSTKLCGAATSQTRHIGHRLSAHTILG